MLINTLAGGAFAILRQAQSLCSFRRHHSFMLRRIGFAIGRFSRLPLQRKLIYAEISIYSLGAWGLVRMAPFKHWRQLLEQGSSVRDHSELTPTDLAFLADIQHVLRQLKWATRNRATCLMMVLVGRWLLNRRRIPGTVYLGVRRDAAKPGLHAHAWLVSAIGVVGHEDVGCFTVVERFGG